MSTVSAARHARRDGPGAPRRGCEESPCWGTPAPDVEIVELDFAGPVLAVRPYARTDHDWQVHFDTNRLIREAFGEAGYAAPAPALAVRGA